MTGDGIPTSSSWLKQRRTVIAVFAHCCILLPPPLGGPFNIPTTNDSTPPPPPLLRSIPSLPQVNLRPWCTPGPIQTDSQQPSCQDAGAQLQLQGVLTIDYAQQDDVVLALQVTEADVHLHQVKEELIPLFWCCCFHQRHDFFVNVALESNSLTATPPLPSFTSSISRHICGDSTS